jgi:hypothetical protein
MSACLMTRPLAFRYDPLFLDEKLAGEGMTRKTYRKKDNQPVIAVQLDLDTDGFTYRKWGSDQRCKRGDWIVRNGDETYTVDSHSFDATYEKVGPGLYRKVSFVYAEQVSGDGDVETKEGSSHFEAGDYLVSNNPDGTDAYCMSAEKFEQMYVEVDPE